MCQRQSGASGYGEPVNIAVIVGGGLVETLQATPLLTALGSVAVDGRPAHRITVACPPVAAAIASGLPAADEVLPLPTLGQAHARGLLAGVIELRRRRLELALVCSDRLRDRALVYLAGIATRAGSASAPGRWLLSEAVPTPAGENRAATWLRVAAHAGIGGVPHVPAFEPGDAARHRAESLLLGQGFEDGRLLVAIAPGAGLLEPSDGDAAPLAWEPERFAHLANQLRQRHGAGVVLLGTDADHPAVERLLLDLDTAPLDLSGELDLPATAAVVERCDLVVAGDGPLLHLAAAVGTPTIGLFGPTDGRMRGPYGEEHRVVQVVPDTADALPGRRRGERAMRRIRVDDVLAGIELAAGSLK